MALESPFYYENGFYHTAKTERFGKLLAHLELYQKIKNLPGDVIECGVLRGNSLIRWAHFRNLLETQQSRKIWGFDVFGNFPRQDRSDEAVFLDKYIADTQDTFIKKEDLEKVIQDLNLTNMELKAGDVAQSIPEFLREEPNVRIALLHVDVDLYKPTSVILELLFDKVVPGGIIAFDDYGLWPGETQAVEEFFKGKGAMLQKLPFSKSPAYFTKPLF